ncbi:MAG TPA: radical SAM family heme chaperone HemW [bacterium]|nr:radical SAM family heme chaperone HemW [bacterium]
MNAYLHIPFCTSICSYCDFTSFAGQEGKMSAYVEALCREIETSSLTGPLETVYFGGGTPSLLLPEKLGLIVETLRMKAGFDGSAEISMEANPETVGRERLQSYRALGVNRLSFGAQAFQKEILKKLGRGHEWDRVEGAFAAAREAGFENINLDLMFGLSGQTLAMFQESLRKAAALNPDHLSLYALQVEEGTPLAKQVAEGLPLPAEDEVADEYAWAQEFLAQQGYEQYEVSNFSKPDKACRHNWNIWRGEDYWGFGLSAVGTVGGVRHSHGDDLTEYIDRIQKGGKVLEWETLSDSIRAWEKLMLGFRTNQGVSKAEVDAFAQSKGISYADKFNRLLKEGFLSLKEDRFRVTSKGYFILNGILGVLAA